MDQVQACEKTGIPLIVIFGEDELARGVVKVKSIADREDKGSDFARADLAAEVRRRLAALA